MADQAPPPGRQPLPGRPGGLRRSGAALRCSPPGCRGRLGVPLLASPPPRPTFARTGLGSVARLRCLCRPFNGVPCSPSPIGVGGLWPRQRASAARSGGAGGRRPPGRFRARPASSLGARRGRAGFGCAAVSAGRQMGTIWAAGPRAPHRPNSSRKT